MKFSRSTYYKTLVCVPSHRQKKYETFIRQVKKVYIESKQWYGATKIWNSLNDSGTACSLKRIQRHMAAQGLRSVVIKKYIYHTVVLMEGSNGPIQVKRKIIRCIASRKDGTRNYVKPGEDIWLYIRLYENGDTKYFISNARAETSAGELGRAATLRWPIEQCFEECKSNLGMSHYECRCYPGWMRHMSFVMAAHLFTLQVRIAVKKGISLTMPMTVLLIQEIIIFTVQSV